MKPALQATRPRLSYFTGLDLGRPHEFTALAVLERSQPNGPSDTVSLGYAVRHLEHFPPGTPYPAIFVGVAQRFALAPLNGSTVVDRTAVGRPVVEALRRSGVRAAIRSAVVTAGHASRREDRGEWLVPGSELAGTLQVLLAAGRLKVADALADADLLAEELANFRAEVPARMDDDTLSWREGRNDDLVLAVALAAWEGERQGVASDTPPRVIVPSWLGGRIT